MKKESVTELLKPDHYFDIQPDSVFNRLVGKVNSVWKILDHMDSFFEEFFNQNTISSPIPGELVSKDWITREGHAEKVIYIQEGFKTRQDVYIPELQIFLGQGTILEPSALIKPPLVVGRMTEIRQGAYIRGGALIGDFCTVGHATEVKTAIFMDHTEAGHFAYVGDSVLGNCVNLGAGTKLANLPFRSLIQKKKQIFEPFEVKLLDQRVDTERPKLGAILGDGVETGCNSTIAPGALVGPDSWILPCLFLRGGYYPARSFIKHPDNALISERR